MNASCFPGKLAIKICPDFLGRIEKPATIITVTGTNGKTTVCNMLLEILEKNGYDVLNNKAGSNINAGIASALIAGSTIAGKQKKEIAVLEVDERSSKLVYPYIQPTYAVCTNLFRDSLHRNANPEFIFNIINNSLPESSHLILNADDLISSNLGENNPKTYFAIDRLPSDREESINLINDVRICPKCHKPLHYNYVRYHHIGNATCEYCGYASPSPDYKAIVNLERENMQLDTPQGAEEYHLISNSIFNVYNQVTAIAVLKTLGLTFEQISKSFDGLNIVESRYSKVTVGNVDVITHMSKGQNPIACSCVFDFVAKEPGKKEVILMLDDVHERKESSENMAWIFDCDFEFLNHPDITNIVISGVRFLDYRLRLLMAGIDDSKLVYTEKELDTPDYLKLDGTNSIYILHQLYTECDAMKVRDKVKEKLMVREATAWAAVD